MAAVISQTSLAIDHSLLKKSPVNVSKIPQRSPFRYPGGKTWFVPWLRLWLSSKPKRPQVLLEPFAGGGIISLTAVAEGIVGRAVMVEIDEDVAAVWQIVFSAQATKLAQQIRRFSFDSESVNEVLTRSTTDTLSRAFRTIVKNRAVHGGILAPGSGLIKSGENGKGISSRWYPDTIAERILVASQFRDKIKIFHADGLEILEAHSGRMTCAAFIDPPYTAGGKRAGARLYKHNELDHARLFAIASSHFGDFLMTYDSAPEVADLAYCHGFDVEAIPMKGTHHNLTHELIVGRDLSWLR